MFWHKPEAHTYASGAMTLKSDTFPLQVMKPSDAEFQLFQAFILRRIGISLTSDKKQMLFVRLRKRLLELGMQRFQHYYDYLVSCKDGTECQHLVDAITTPKTEFFREYLQFEFLVETCFPVLAQRALFKKQRRIRIWSVACATGEERKVSMKMRHSSQKISVGSTL